MARARKPASRTGNGATVGYEAELWQMAGALRGSMAPGEYEHLVLGLALLKYVSTAFEVHRSALDAQKAKGDDPEAPADYRASSIFLVSCYTRLRSLV